MSPPAELAKANMAKTTSPIRIVHAPSGDIIAEGALGLRGIFPFEGNYYIHGRCLRTTGFQPNWIPGLCIYKFLYVWLDFAASNGAVERSLGWLYWLPNPLFFFVSFKTAVPMQSPVLRIEEGEAAAWRARLST